MILVHEAGARRRSGLFDQRTLPLLLSMRMPLRALTEGAAALACVPPRPATAQASVVTPTARIAAAASAARSRDAARGGIV